MSSNILSVVWTCDIYQTCFTDLLCFVQHSTLLEPINLAFMKVIFVTLSSSIDWDISPTFRGKLNGGTEENLQKDTKFLERY